MNNEEKILEMLGQVVDRLDRMDGRLDRVDGRLDRLEADVTDLKADVAGIKLRLENEVTQKFNLLAEGQQTILETLASKSRVEALEDDQQLLKHVVALHSRDIAELKKAE